MESCSAASSPCSQLHGMDVFKSRSFGSSPPALHRRSPAATGVCAGVWRGSGALWLFWIHAGTAPACAAWINQLPGGGGSSRQARGPGPGQKPLRVDLARPLFPGWQHPAYCSFSGGEHERRVDERRDATGLLSQEAPSSCQFPMKPTHGPNREACREGLVDPLPIGGLDRPGVTLG